MITRLIKPKLKREDEEEPDTWEPIKVLSLNINGGSLKEEGGWKASKSGTVRVGSWGKTPPARHALVSEVVKETDPDILLLQETKSRPLVREIAGKFGYAQMAPLEEEGARKNSWQEAKVLYDETKFEIIDNGEKLDLALNTLDRATYHVKLREKEMGKPRDAGVGQVIKERVSWVCLRRKYGPNAGKIITFMSFHNYNNTESHKGARVFCELVRAMKNEIGSDVIAGVDFNCEEESICPTTQRPIRSVHPGLPTRPIRSVHPGLPTRPIRSIHPGLPTHPIRSVHPGLPTRPIRSIHPGLPTRPIRSIHEEFNTKQKWNGINIPQYDMSPRRKRKGKRKIDFIVTTLEQYKVSVEAIDFTAPGGAASELEGMQIKDSKNKTHKYCSNDFDIVLDHDPLLCTFNLGDTTCTL